jgi:hypothetical protein
MRIPVKLAIFGAAMALGVTPALAAAPSGIPANSGTSHMPSDPGSQGTSHKPSTPGPNASFPKQAKAYGKFCQGLSKNHTSGQKGTPFSNCVTDMVKLSHGQSKSPRAACANESKKPASGQSRSDFSLCVSGGAKLLRQQHNS